MLDKGISKSILSPAQDKKLFFYSVISRHRDPVAVSLKHANKIFRIKIEDVIMKT